MRSEKIASSLGNRLYLREVRTSDVNEKYYRWLNDPEVNCYLETRFVPRSIDNIREFVHRLDSNVDEPFFAICLLDSDAHIGNIKIGPINWIHRNADISLFIGDKENWGKGYATEAINLVTDFAFQTLNLNKLKASCYADNLGSAKAFEKAGYEHEGLLRGHVISNGREIDVIVFGLRAKLYWKRLNSRNNRFHSAAQFSTAKIAV
jgi:[ribosomal protein S5]-alanine N-acetyltransferase